MGLVSLIIGQFQPNFPDIFFNIFFAEQMKIAVAHHFTASSQNWWDDSELSLACVASHRIFLLVLNAGNGWEWGNGTMISSYYGSFPHSLLSTSKFS